MHRKGCNWATPIHATGGGPGFLGATSAPESSLSQSVYASSHPPIIHCTCTGTRSSLSCSFSTACKMVNIALFPSCDLVLLPWPCRLQHFLATRRSPFKALLHCCYRAVMSDKAQYCSGAGNWDPSHCGADKVPCFASNMCTAHTAFFHIPHPAICLLHLLLADALYTFVQELSWT